MEVQVLLRQLRMERDDLSATIAVLEKRLGVAKAAAKNTTGKMSEATKAKLRAVMKAKWEQRRAAGKKSSAKK